MTTRFESVVATSWEGQVRMHPFVEKLARVLRDDKRPSLSMLTRKVGASALALAKGSVVLRACTKVGPRARAFGRRPHVVNRGVLRIGADFSTSSAFGVVQLSTAPEGVLDIGDGVSINYGTAVSARRSVRVGHRTKIGPYCVIADSDLPFPLEVADGDRSAAIDIGDDVWLGGRVTILPGVHIGNGAVVSAGSVVSGDIPPNAVASGNPARVLRVTSGPPPSGERVRAAPIAPTSSTPASSTTTSRREAPHVEHTDVDRVELG